MFCTECGYKLEDDFKFCPNCGTKLMESEDKILPQDYMGANGQREIRQEEIERLTEEIFWRSLWQQRIMRMICLKHWNIV